MTNRFARFPIGPNEIEVRLEVEPELRRFYETDDARGLNARHTERIRRILTALKDAPSPRNRDLPGWRPHALQGNREGPWSVRVSGNWRIVFRFEASEAVDIDLVDYH